jgi:hypothetical protein
VPHTSNESIFTQGNFVEKRLQVGFIIHLKF